MLDFDTGTHICLVPCVGRYMFKLLTDTYNCDSNYSLLFSAGQGESSEGEG